MPDVRLRRSVPDPRWGHAPAGAVIHVPDEIAARLEQHGLAEIETATNERHERAVRRPTRR